MQEMDAIWGVWQFNQSKLGLRLFHHVPPARRIFFYEGSTRFPGTSGKMNLYYYRLPRPVSATDYLDLPSGWEDLVRDYAEYLCKRSDHDPDAVAAKQIYENKLTEMIDKTRRYVDQPSRMTTGFDPYPWYSFGESPCNERIWNGGNGSYIGIQSGSACWCISSRPGSLGYPATRSTLAFGAIQDQLAQGQLNIAGLKGQQKVCLQQDYSNQAGAQSQNTGYRLQQLGIQARGRTRRFSEKGTSPHRVNSTLSNSRTKPPSMESVSSNCSNSSARTLRSSDSNSSREPTNRSVIGEIRASRTRPSMDSSRRVTNYRARL